VAEDLEAGLGGAGVGHAGVAPGVEPPELVDALDVGLLPGLLGVGDADRADRVVAALDHLVVEHPLDLGGGVELDAGQGVLAGPVTAEGVEELVLVRRGELKLGFGVGFDLLEDLHGICAHFLFSLVESHPTLGL
jgi:hypothetical protein